MGKDEDTTSAAGLQDQFGLSSLCRPHFSGAERFSVVVSVVTVRRPTRPGGYAVTCDPSAEPAEPGTYRGCSCSAGDTRLSGHANV